MILMVLIIPFTKAIVGTMLGAQAAIPALVLSAAPFYARLVEIAFVKSALVYWKQQMQWEQVTGKSSGRS